MLMTAADWLVAWSLQSLQYLFSLNLNSNFKLTTLAGAFKVGSKLRMPPTSASCPQDNKFVEVDACEISWWTAQTYVAY